MTDNSGNNSLSRLEPFLLIAKSAKGAAAAKLVQDALSAHGVFVFAELLEIPNIQELEKSEQGKGWFEILQLFSFGTYQDYKTRSANLPKLTPVQETKLKYLSLCTLARKDRVLPYSRLQDALDIHVIRDLEDLIIDAMYQDVIRGKLDQRQSTFEVEWSMGRDMQKEDIQNLLQQLNNWNRMTGVLLESMDKKIKRIREEQSQSETLRIRQNILLRENVKEIAEKINPPSANRPARKGGRPGEASLESMEIDDRTAPGGSTNRNAASSSSATKSEHADITKHLRKRNRGA